MPVFPLKSAIITFVTNVISVAFTVIACCAGCLAVCCDLVYRWPVVETSFTKGNLTQSLDRSS
jgi:hypothetical protein